MPRGDTQDKVRGLADQTQGWGTQGCFAGTPGRLFLCWPARPGVTETQHAGPFPRATFLPLFINVFPGILCDSSLNGWFN